MIATTEKSMTTALICSHPPLTAPTLSVDLQAAGIQVLATLENCNMLVQSVVLHAPDVVICYMPLPDGDWFAALQAVNETAPCPTLVFTDSWDAGAMAQAVDCGVHVYVVQGYSAQRLPVLIQLAQVRHQKAQQQRQAYAELATRFEERKAVDRAKGILMRTQSLSDDDAFRTLRSAAMNSNQRMGQLSQHIIASAQVAESVNRAGQLRMLSQRLVKLHLLQAAGVQAAHHAALLQASVQWVDGNVALLRKSISRPADSDLLEQVAQTWEHLKAALALADTLAVEPCAEALLQGAERLTASLEGAGAGAPLQVLNLAGRQRMLSQRFSKYALLALAGQLGSVGAVGAAQAGMNAAQQEFEAALTYLNGIPLSTPDIHAALGAAGVAWLQMVAAAKDAQRPPVAQRGASLQALASGSETLLGLFEQLSEHYERSMQMLVG
jgi:AmiR/NasT family two-component response regulator